MMFVFLLCAIRCVVCAHPGVTRAAAVKPTSFKKSRRFNLIPPYVLKLFQTCMANRFYYKSTRMSKWIKNWVWNWLKLGLFWVKLALNWLWIGFVFWITKCPRYTYLLVTKELTLILAYLTLGLFCIKRGDLSNILYWSRAQISEKWTKVPKVS